MRDKVTGQCPQTTTFEEKGEPKRIRTEIPLLQYQPNALPLGQTGSQVNMVLHVHRKHKAYYGRGERGREREREREREMGWDGMR